MQKLSPFLKVLSIVFLCLAFASIFLTLVNNGSIGVSFSEGASFLKNFIEFFPSWLGLYPFAVFFFLASIIALCIHPIGKRLILYAISFVILAIFTLISKYLVVNKGNITFVLMIVAALLVMLSFGFLVIFYKDTDKKPKDKKYRATLKEKKELKLKEKEAAKQEKALLKEIENEKREKEKSELLLEAEKRRLERERLAEEKERLRKQAIEERRIALEERKALRQQELQDREQKRQEMLSERQREKERLIQEREELVKQRNAERELEKQRRLDEKNKAIAEYNAEIQRKKEEAMEKAEERKALLQQREKERLERKEAELKQRQRSPIPSPVQFPPESKPWDKPAANTEPVNQPPISQPTVKPQPSYTPSKIEDDDDYDDVIIVEDDDDEESNTSYQSETLKRNIQATIKPATTTTQNQYVPTQTATPNIQTPSSSPTNQTYVSQPKTTIPSFTPPQVKQEKEEKQEEVDNNEEMSGIGGLSEKSSRPRTFHYAPPSIDLLEDHPSKTPPSTPMELEIQMTTLIEALKSYNILCDGDGYIQGPTVTLFKLIPHIGVKVSKIASLADDIARYLGVSGSAVRVIPTIPGTHDIGIEIPNSSRQMVSFKSLVPSLLIKKLSLPFSLGKTITGETVEIDIAKTPHLLIAGATGSGKSVCVNSMIASLLYKKGPGDVRMIMVDPKVVELQMYNGIPHLLTPVITEPKKAIKALDFAIEEMERRYRILEGLHVRNIIGYNEKLKEEKIKREKLPYILIIVDEFADLMLVVGKELEARIARLAAKARAVGIHLVLATQRPSTDVVTGTLKNNLPSRIAFRVPSGIDSRTIIDVFGAEKLLGNGDMLYKAPDASDSQRIQGAFLSDEETERIVNYCKTQGTPTYIDESWFEEKQSGSDSDDDDTDYSNSSDEDQLRRAWEVCAESGKCSTTFIQRRLRIGYPTAARLVDELEERGIVSPSQGAKPREVLKFPD